MLGNDYCLVVNFFKNILEWLGHENWFVIFAYKMFVFHKNLYIRRTLDFGYKVD